MREKSHDSVNVNTNSHAPEFGVDEEELIRLFKEEDLKNSVSNFGWVTRIIHTKEINV